VGDQVCRSGIHAQVPLPERAGGRSKNRIGYLGPDSIFFFALFWHPSYTDTGRFGWRDAEGAVVAARAVSGEEAEAEVGKCSNLYAAVTFFR
jgi:hypothetical protein